MDAHWLEWLNLTVRWLHMIVGIAWIGASFYFVWLENNLDRKDPAPGLAGELWAIHGGGIYHLTKYKLAPEQMPQTLHWFKWEAYSTWLTGMLLLSIVYYFNAELYLIAPGSELSSTLAIVTSLVSLVLGWFIYSALCNSPLARNPILLGLVLFALLAAASFGYAQIFSPRAAYIHTGALIGTLMVGNVFAVIMPVQRDLVGAITQGREPNPALPAKGLLHSRHNNYLTLPVLFIMISNHFPSTYGHSHGWLILVALAGLSVLVRHYFNTRQQSQRFAWALPAAALGMLCLAYMTKPSAVSPPAQTAEVITPRATSSELSQVLAVVETHCQNCHSATPSSELFSSAPGGVIFDSPQQIADYKQQIKALAVDTQVMPMGNFTQMSEAERQLLGRWISNGAPLEE